MAHKPIFELPDTPLMYPIVTLLPVRGSAPKLRPLMSSLFARHERLHQAISEMEMSEIAPEVRKRYLSEEAMLRQVLDWLGADLAGGA
jgi:hypothetical protein